MNGPVRPHTMQTATPFTSNAAFADVGDGSSAKVRNSIRSCEDWSVTPTSWQARRWR
jgi:hypothetical protein